MAGQGLERFEREVLGEGLAPLDVDLPHVVIDGGGHQRVLRSTETCLSAVGPLTRERTLCRMSLDWVVVPIKAGRREGKQAQAHAEGKQRRGPAGCQEVRCATPTFCGAAGERLQTLRFGRMPAATQATMKPMLSAEVQAQGNLTSIPRRRAA